MTIFFLTHISTDVGIRYDISPNGYAWDKTLDTYKVPRGVRFIASNAFKYSSLKTIIFNEEMESLQSNALAQAAQLENVIFHPNNRITELPSQLFSECTSLKNITLPNNLTTIGQTCFNQTIIESIVIPSSVTSIGAYCFRQCTALQYLILEPINPPSLGTKMFYGFSSYPNIYVPDESVDAYKSATNWTAFADKIYPVSEFTE